MNKIKKSRKHLGDIPTENFRAIGYQIIDQITDYLDNIEKFPVLSQNEPGRLKRSLPSSAPAHGEDFSEILKDVEKLILPAVTHWNHPNFHGLFSTSASAVGIFADMFASAFDMKAMLWRTAPASTELEQVTLDWLRQMLNLPSEFSGIIYDTASVSSLHAIAMARQRIAPQIREEGMNASSKKLRIYCSEQTHSSIEKAVILLGLGRKSLIKIPTDDQFSVKIDKLEEAIIQDRKKGYLPFCVVATIGTTSTASIDNVEQISKICKQQNCFLHVDAAYAGSAAIVPEFKDKFKGWEMADTIVINPHKWLFTPFDLSVLYVKDMPLLKETFSLVPEYLKTSEINSEEVINQMDYGIQLGRRFRALKLWFAMRYFGQEGMINRIRENCRLANLFADWVKKSSNFQLLAPVNFALVCFRAYIEEFSQAELNSINETIMNKINASGKAYLSHTKLNGNFALRLSVGSLRTEEKHLKRVWKLLNQALSETLLER